MQNIDFNLIKKNISAAINSHGLKPTNVAPQIDTSQPNLSRALKEDGSQLPTLEQVIKLSRLLNMSIDDLLFGTSKENVIDSSPKSIATIIIDLLNSDSLKMETKSQRETISKPEYISDTFQVNIYDKEIVYPYFYLPSYWQVDESQSEEEIQFQYSEFSQIGNETRYKQLNDVLLACKTLIDNKKSILDDNHNANTEAYDTAISSLINTL